MFKQLNIFTSKFTYFRNILRGIVIGLVSHYRLFDEDGILMGKLYCPPHKRASFSLYYNLFDKDDLPLHYNCFSFVYHNNYYYFDYYNFYYIYIGVLVFETTMRIYVHFAELSSENLRINKLVMDKISLHRIRVSL